MIIGFSTAYAATPKYSADKAVLAYAELYTFGESENVAATGMPQDVRESVEKFMANYIMMPFKNYPLNKSVNFQFFDSYFFDLRSFNQLIKRSDNQTVNTVNIYRIIALHYWNDFYWRFINVIRKTFEKLGN